ncbi:MAG TPA: sigma-70 family RNA polymerase sigma factor [Acidimicrobiales bacterium]|nr:sigma-70 family RNA polymerase sigma factor [Acidimicrobiales bacterium]
MTIRDEGEYEAFYDEHFDLVRRYVRRRVDPLDTDDVVAHVFVVAWRRWDNLPTDRSEHLPWLYGVARNAVADRQKAMIRRNRLEEKVRRTAPLRPEPSAGAGEANEAHDRVLRALGHLKPDDQEVLRLVAWERLSRPDAARVLGCSVSALNLKYLRARRRLAERFAGMTPSERVVTTEEVTSE